MIATSHLPDVFQNMWSLCRSLFVLPFALLLSIMSEGRRAMPRQAGQQHHQQRQGQRQRHGQRQRQHQLQNQVRTESRASAAAALVIAAAAARASAAARAATAARVAPATALVVCGPWLGFLQTYVFESVAHGMFQSWVGRFKVG